MTQQNKAIVIGSGFGGLSVAIRLQSAGWDTLILEKRDRPGGRAYVYHDQGFTFDAGPTVITAPQCLQELFEISNEKMEDFVELQPVSPFYRLYWEDGYQFDYSNDLNALLTQIAQKSPLDREGYQNFLKYSETVFHEGYTKLAHTPFLDWWSMIKVSPQLIQLKAYRSVYQMVSQYIQDPQLRQAFSFHSLLVGGNPFSTSSIYTLIHYLERNWGVWFPKGGTGALVQALVHLFEKKGGQILLNQEVEEILTQQGKTAGVRLKTGTFLPSNIVICNSDVHHVYHHLLKNEKRVSGLRKKLDKMSYSMSLFVIYFGTRKRYPHIAHHSVMFGPRYQGLLEDIFENGKLASDFSLYLHAPTRTDPSLAPPDCESFYVLSPVPHLGKLNMDWSVEGPRYAKRILDYLEKYYLPDLSQNIVTQRIFTPFEFQTDLNSHLGAAFALEPILTQSAYFRAHNKDPKIEGLYLVGAGTHPGAGVPGVVNSAKATAGIIEKDYPWMPKSDWRNFPVQKNYGPEIV